MGHVTKWSSLIADGKQATRQSSLAAKQEDVADGDRVVVSRSRDRWGSGATLTSSPLLQRFIEEALVVARVSDVSEERSSSTRQLVT